METMWTRIKCSLWLDRLRQWWDPEYRYQCEEDTYALISLMKEQVIWEKWEQ